MKRLILYVSLTIFISGCIATSRTVTTTTMPQFPPESLQKEVVPEPEPSAVTEVPFVEVENKVTYSQITNLLSEIIEIQVVEGVSSIPKFLGTSEDGLVTVEIIGEKDNILEASLKLVYPEDIQTVNADLNNAIMLRFLRNIAAESQEWPDKVQDITAKLSSIEKGNLEEEIIRLDERIVRILYDKDIDAVTLTMEHK